jgi:DNA polymerase-1
MEFLLVEAAPALAEALQLLGQSNSIAIDTETAIPRNAAKRKAYDNIYNQTKTKELAPFDPHTAEVRLVQMKGENTPPIVVDLWKLDPASVQCLAEFLEGYAGEYLLANAKFDLKHLKSSLGIWLDRHAQIFDVIQASVLLSNSVGMGNVRGHRLMDLSRDFLGIVLDKTEQASDWSLDLTAEQLNYAAADVLHLHDLKAVLSKALLEELGQVMPLALEMAVIGPTARMEYAGVPFDLAVFAKVQEAAKTSLPKLLSEIAVMFKEKLGAKIQVTRETMTLSDGSTVFETALVPYWAGKSGNHLLQARGKILEILQQMGLVNDAGDLIDNTRAGDLKVFAEEHPEVELLLNYWTLSKQVQFDYDKWVHPLTGRIHPTFRISGAGTGRFTCNNPNLQQVPSKVNLKHPDGSVLNYRYCFKSKGNKVIASCDFSGQELSIMAALSQDPLMLKLLNEGGDIHAEAAASMFGIDPAESRNPIPGQNGTYRDRGKVMVFSTVYGKTDKGFADLWKISEAEAKKLTSGFKKRFHVLAAWIEEAGAKAEAQQFTVLPIGARRFLGGEGESAGAKNARKRAGGNTQIQGSGSWMTKIAMIELDRAILKGGLSMNLIGTIHDELLTEIEASPNCPSLKLQLGLDAQANELKAEQNKEALKVHKADVEQRCHAGCGNNCVVKSSALIGSVMKAAGDRILNHAVPAAFSSAIAQHWEH